MKGRAVSFGALSVVNAIASGKGATVGVKLRTEATVEVVEGRKKWEAKIGGRQVFSSLATETVKEALRILGERPEKYGGSVETRSEIPTRVGLKSSSSSSVAIALATFGAFGKREYSPPDILDCSVKASLASRASITGALDDAASCLSGGLNLSDNLQNKVLTSSRIEERLSVLIMVPKSPSRRGTMDLAHVRTFKDVANSLFEMAASGSPWRAMTLNGLLYSSLLGYPVGPTIRAVELGALGAGLSGTGPAVAAVFDEGDKEDPRSLARQWESDGSRLIATTINNERGGIVEQ